MARAIWSGTISFGLVNVPVKLYSAVHSKDLQFHQFDPKGNRIQYKRVSEKSGREVDYSDIVKGYEVKKGQYVMVDPDELQAYRPESTKTIEISDFVDLDEIDPIYYETTYYLAPDGKAAEKAYNLLLQSMEKQGKAAIGKVVIRTKQYLAAIRPLDGVLALSTMRFADEVVPTSEVKNGSSGKDASVSSRRGRHGVADHRLTDVEVGPVAVPRHLPRAGARAAEEEGRGQGDRGRRARRGQGPGARPHGRPRGQPGRGQGRRRAFRFSGRECREVVEGQEEHEEDDQARVIAHSSEEERLRDLSRRPSR
jgi:Ku protein